MGFMGAIGLSALIGLSFYEPKYEITEGEADSYTVMEEYLGEYEVQEGDCLWSISEEVLGDGGAYPKLAEMNPDVVSDPDLIYPHTILELKRNVYVKERTDREGTRLAEIRFGALEGWTVGYAQAGEAFSSFAFTNRDGARVVCMIRESEKGSGEVLSDWEGSRETLEEYVGEHYGSEITDLTFGRYRSEKGCEIGLYSYVYEIRGEPYGLKGSLPVYVSHGICLSEHIQAEFTGFHTEEGMEDVVRYLTATFEELPSDGLEFSVNDSNVTMGPSEAWVLPGVHNPFVWIREYFDGVFSEAIPEKPEDKSAKDRVLGR